MRKGVRSLAAIGLILLLSGFGISSTSGANSGFPAKLQNLIGAGSYAALYGHDEDVLEPQAADRLAERFSSNENGIVVGTNVRVNAVQRARPNGLFGRSETTIAAGGNGQRLVAGYNFADGFLRPPFTTVNPLPGTPGLSGFAFSRDGGATWTDGGVPPVIDNIVTRGDPWLDVGGTGSGERFFYANLAVDLRLPRDQSTLGVSVHRGHFTTTGFSWDDVRLLQAPNYPADFYDKEAITVGKGTNAGRGIVTLSNFIETCGLAANGNGQIEAWRTSDGGNSWHGPVIVNADITFDLNPSSPTCGEGTQQQASSAAFGINSGEVYVVWERGPNFDNQGNPTSKDADILVARSFNGGQTFDTPVKVASINSMFENPPVGYNRSFLIDHPRIAVDTTEEHRGRIYVVYYTGLEEATPSAPTEQVLTSAQIFLRFSDDRGLSWSRPTAVAPHIPPTGVKRIFPVVMTGDDGTVSVFYYDVRETVLPAPCNQTIGGGLRRIGPASSLVDSFVVVSRNGGRNFGAPVRVSSVTSNWCTTVSNIRPNFGDYLGSTSLGAKIFPVWADGRNGVPDTFFAPVTVGAEEANQP